MSVPQREDFDAACSTLNSARTFEQEHSLSGSAEAARTEELLGGVLSGQDRLAEAADALNRSVEIRKRLVPVDSIGLVASYVSLGNLSRRAGDFEPASRRIRDGLAILNRLSGNHQLELAYTLLAAGSIENASGEYDSGIMSLSRALSLLDSCGRSKSLVAAQVYIWLGACHAHKGEYSTAMEYQKQALDICRTASNGNASIGNCYALIGEQYDNLGDYEKAVEYMTQALQLIRSSLNKHHSSLAGPLSLLGNAYLELKQPERALTCVNQAIAIREKSFGTQHPTLRHSYEIKGDILRSKKEPRQAMKYYRKALAICQRIDPNLDRYDVIRLFIAMGSTDAELGKLHQADSLLRSALERSSRSTTNSPVQTAAAHKALGDLLSRQGKYEGALQEYQGSIINLCTDFADTSLTANPTPGQVRSAKEIVPVLAAKGKALQQLYGRKAHDPIYLALALKSYSAALDVGDEAQRNLTSMDAKLFHEEESSSLYEAAVDLAVDLLRITGDSSYRERAFTLAERSRAQVVLENINESRVEHFAGIPDSVLKKESALRAEVNSCDILIERGLAGLDSIGRERLTSLNNRRFAAGTALDQLDEQLQKEYPLYYESRSGRPALRLDSLRRMLGSNSALVEYFAGKSRLHIFVLNSDTLQLVTVPGAKIAGDVEGFLSALKSIDQQSYQRYAAELYQSTIAPVRRWLHGITRLVLVPDGPLCYLPFEALFESAPSGKAGKPIETTKLPYLVRSFDITYSYSASFYAECFNRTRAAAPLESFAGFAPVFADTEGTSVLLASDLLSHREDALALRSITVDGNHFRELKYSEDEVQSIGASCRKSGLSVLQFLRGRATEEAFKQSVGRSKFVHVATHGLMNGEHPRLSGILFSAAADGGQEDGILYAGETYNLKLDADLLVLSSCQSGAGRLVRGEGVMSITRGFFYAGARNIVVSLWRIYDKQTAQFMKELYRHILNGDNYSRALRRAKLRMIESPSTSFPGKWAGFVLLGR